MLRAGAKIPARWPRIQKRVTIWYLVNWPIFKALRRKTPQLICNEVTVNDAQPHRRNVSVIPRLHDTTGCQAV